jgi:threonyl-tRNA synthetase
MKYFVLNKHKQMMDAASYLKNLDRENDFARFIRREVFGESLAPERKGKPDYLNYANKLGFNWEERSESGFVQYNHKADLMRRLVMDYARRLVGEIGFPVYEVSGSNLFNLEHPVVKAYAALYGDRLYRFNSGGNDVVLSYDASYPQFNLAGKKPLSYRQLPFAHFSVSDCYRHEQSGELMLLMRQRRFYMPDIHPYFRDIEEAFRWFPLMQAKIIESARNNGKSYQVIVEVASQEVWEEYRHRIEEIPRWLDADVLVKVLDDGQDRYWIVNVDYKYIDQLGQSREIACIQVDVGNASRLGINYIDEEGRSQSSIIVHSAIPGGVERFLYILFDSFDSGFPLWLHPIQLRLLPVNSNYVEDCQAFLKEIDGLPLRVEIDDRNISVSAKVKSAYQDLVPHKVVIGERDKESGFASVRELIANLAANCQNMPFLPRGWPMELSRQ